MTKPWWIKKSDLDEFQLRALEQPAGGKYIVTGPPGSGKSNLLILRARHLQVHGITDYRVLAFNQVLVRFLRSSGAIHDEQVTTAMAWLEDQHYTLNGKPIAENDFAPKRAALLRSITKHLEDHNISGLIDTLFVGEFQDYKLEEIRMFSRIARNLFLVGDIHQQIYESNLSVKAFEELKNEFTTFELPYHYRIGHDICRLADRIAKYSQSHVSLLEGCRYDEAKDGKATVEQLYRANLDDQISEVIRRLSIQLAAYQEDEYIGVLCPGNDLLKKVAPKLIRAYGKIVSVQQSGDAQDFEPPKRIILSNLHNGKGLEYRAVHVLALDQLRRQDNVGSGAKNRQLTYTAVTRGKTNLSLYCDNQRKIQTYLEDALSGANADEVSADDVF